MTIGIEVTEGIMQNQQQPSVQQSTAQNFTKNGQSFTLLYKKCMITHTSFNVLSVYVPGCMRSSREA